ncbi:SulP family inorganic anion transporter [Pseudaminobacter soli (ex Li et al. 2025)]|uniref:Sulfate transporter n=1 Tax=Pseudaminobacter soli (ex Li et al. 2025) TaxID=1295366 RepID=A0A2P7SBI6_9HYPH|nr:SulP family inorganic anion transporter [Mesorhizobium soli]PSJ59882.1 sulfate transporter [Mesorhizobium soli]
MLGRLPVLTSLRGYQSAWIRNDVTAGLAIAAVAIPSAIAYPAIAGLPPEVGVYSSILPLVGYALFGPSRKLIVGPDAATMTVLAAVLANTMANTPRDRVVVASALALVVGVYCLIGSRLRLGVLAAFLSKPILVGFISGISISILVGQIGRFTGLRIESDGLIPPLVELLQKSSSIHWPSVLFGVAMLVILIALKRSPIPGPVVVVVIAVAASALFDFEGRGIKVVGTLPRSLPALSFPLSPTISARDLLLGGAAVWLVGFGSGLVTARSFAAREKLEVDANAELNGFGAANIASGLFSGFPVTVSDSRTATNISVGGRSQLAGLVAALALTISLFYLNDALRLMPQPALGAILVAAAISLIDVKSLREIWHISKLEFAFALIGMWGAISLGVLQGVVIAVAGTLLYVLLKEMRPRDALLGQIPGQHGFYKLHRSKLARPVSGLAICLIQGSLLFFNVDYVKARLRAILEGLPKDTRWFVLDASAIVQIDSTAAEMLEEIREACAERGLAFGLAELHIEPTDILERAGLLQKVGEAMIFDDLEDVATAFDKGQQSPKPQLDDRA